jgi:hypothetical protein
MLASQSRPDRSVGKMCEATGPLDRTRGSQIGNPSDTKTSMLAPRWAYWAGRSSFTTVPSLIPPASSASPFANPLTFTDLIF